LTTIAVVGKGGVGKTAIAALLIKVLSEKGVVLAVDADPSTNLNLALGLPLKETVGRVREDLTEAITRGRLPSEVSKQELLDMKIREALVESAKIDLLAMGRPEGSGCYCAANHMLRLSIDRLAKNYDYTIIDCEAGMEHISRQTTRDIDILLIISDPTIRGVTAAVRMKELMTELRTRAGKIYLAVNRVRNGLPKEIGDVIDNSRLDLIATISEDPNLASLEVKGSPLTELPPDSSLQVGVRKIVTRLGF
jgi:CO dehydrogenase maturation factor